MTRAHHPGTHLSLALDETVFDDAQCRDNLLPKSFDAGVTVARSLRGTSVWLRERVSASLLLRLRRTARQGEVLRPDPTHFVFSQGSKLFGGERLHRLDFVIDTLLLRGTFNRGTKRQRDARRIRGAAGAWHCEQPHAPSPAEHDAKCRRLRRCLARSRLQAAAAARRDCLPAPSSHAAQQNRRAGGLRQRNVLRWQADSQASAAAEQQAA